MTAAKMFLLGETRLGEGVLQNVEASYNSKVAKEREDAQKKAETYQKSLRDAEAVHALNLDPSAWNLTHLRAVLKPLKTKEDTAMPTKKAKLFERWLLWQGRTAPAADMIAPDDGANGAAPLDTAPLINDTDAETYGCSEEEDAIAAMMMLNGTSDPNDALQTEDV